MNPEYGMWGWTIGLLGISLSVSVCPVGANEADYLRLNREACELYHRGKYSDGLRKVDQAIAIDPGNLIGQTTKGMILSADNRCDEADSILRSVIKKDPKFPEAHMWLAFNWLKREQPKAALDEMRIYASQRGIDACFDHLAAILIMADRPREAIQLCLQYLKKHPRSVAAKRLQATALAQLGDCAQALRLLDSIKSKSQNSAGFHEQRAYCLARLERQSGAREELLKALSAEPEPARILITNRIRALRILNLSAPLAVYESVYRVPLSTDELRRVELRRVMQASNPDAIIIELSSKVRTKTAQPDDLRSLGKLLWRGHRASEAIAAYDRLVELCPRDFEAVFERGQIYNQLLMDTEAIRDLTRAIELHPESRESYRLRALSFKRQGRMAEARADLIRAGAK